jgi:hypothetical protein
MRAAAEKIAGSGQILNSATAFFRRGVSGAGSELLTADELDRSSPSDRRVWPFTWVFVLRGAGC